MIKAAIGHVGLSVANLDRSVRFYRDLLGMELVLGPQAFAGEFYETILGLKGASGKVAFLRSASLHLEVFEFSHPAPRPHDPQRPVCDHGITHVCFEVEGIDRMYDRLQAAGVSFHCPPLRSPAGNKATYARDPDGNVVELLEKAERR